MSNKIIKRDYYLNKLITNKDRDRVKVVTGVRRSGKSFLLFNLYYKYLLKSGIDSKHIIKIDLETQKNKPLRDSQKLYDYILGKKTDKKRHYVFIDEIQLVDEFEDLVNGLRVDENCDVYITGSNSSMLSKDINTKFRGRNVEIKVYPLSFKEYYSFVKGDKYKAFNDYLVYGGLPYLNDLNTITEKSDYLKTICSTLLIRDIIDRYKIRNENIFEAVLDFLCSNIGSYVSANKIANTLKSNGYKSITDDTVGNYLNYICDAFLFYKAQRYDIKGKAYLKTLNKYYVTDLGIRNSRLNFRQLEITHTIENLVYLELLRRGYIVDIGKNINKEIDFIARSNSELTYIQVAYSVAEPQKLKQETESFKGLDDGYRKILITMDNDPYNLLENGYQKINLIDFLLQDSF